MRLLLIGAVALVAVCCSPAGTRRDDLYADPAGGRQMWVDNQKSRKRVLGSDLYCIRDILIDGVKVFGGNRCRIKNGEKTMLHLTPGRHQVVFDTMSEWGTDYAPGVPPMLLTVTVDARDKNLLVLLRAAEPPEVSPLATPGPAIADAMDPPSSPLPIPSVSTDTAPAPAASTGTAPDPFKSLERLKELRDKGVITDDEFKAKKAELLKEIR